jgi:hypothetical protein
MQSVDQTLCRIEELQTLIAFLKKRRYAESQSEVSGNLRRRE